MIRSWQGSNLRGQSPLDFKSNALTTRPQLPLHKKAMKNENKIVEMRGIEPRAFHMQSERSTTELHPLLLTVVHERRQAVKKNVAPGEARTHGLQIMRLTRCLLRYGGTTLYDKKIVQV